jgi:hypothetical protein
VASSLFGVVTGICVFAFFLALGSGVRDVMLGEVFPIDKLEVVPGSGGLAALGLLAPGGGERRTIPEDRVDRVRTIPGVEAVFPRMRLDFPAKAWGGEKVFGEQLWTEVVADGIPAELVRDELGSDTLFRDMKGEDSNEPCRRDDECPAGEYCAEQPEGPRACAHPVPFLVSRYLIELYNGTLVSSHDLPRLPEWVLRKGRGLELEMGIGRSSLGTAPQGRPRTVRIVFAGVSDQAIDIGITVPLAYARRWNEEFVGTEASRGYSSLTVVVTHKDMVTPVVERLKRMGLAIQSKGAEQVGLMITLFESTFTVIAVLILVISAFNISHAFFLVARERRREIGIMRAVGATRGDILGSFLIEGGILGVAGSLLGLLTALLLALVGNWVAAHFLPEFPFKPDDFFRFSPRLVLVSLALGTLSCLAGAALPAHRASRQDPSLALM